MPGGLPRGTAVPPLRAGPPRARAVSPAETDRRRHLPGSEARWPCLRPGERGTGSAGRGRPPPVTAPDGSPPCSGGTAAR